MVQLPYTGVPITQPKSDMQPSRAHMSPSRLAPVILSGISNTAKRGVREARERVRVGLWCVGHCSIQDLPCPQPNRGRQGKEGAGCVWVSWGLAGDTLRCPTATTPKGTPANQCPARAKRSGQARTEVSGHSVGGGSSRPSLPHFRFWAKVGVRRRVGARKARKEKSV